MGGEANRRTEEDPFVCEMLYLMPPDAIAPDKELELRRALEKGSARSRHAVDIRLTLPLIFTQLYFVVQIGKDHRRTVQKEYRERKQWLAGRASLVGWALAAAAVFVLGFIVLYALKCKAGIDIFKHAHLHDFVPFAPTNKPRG